MENLTFCKKSACLWFVALLVGFSGQVVKASDGILLSNPPSLSSQGIDPVIFTFNCIDGQPGDTVCIPVTVQDFNDIVIAQFEIIWDSDVLDYIEVQNPGSPSINVNADFNLSGPNALKFIPLGFPIVGESLPDGTVLFEVCFRVIGIPGSTSPLGISPFFDFEVADVNGVIPADSVSCMMMVNSAVNLVGFVTSCGVDTPGINGTIDLTVYGGTMPYTITWVETVSGATGVPVIIPVEGGSTVLSVPAGNYNVIITDALGTNVTYNTDVVAVELDVATRLRHPTCYKFENGTIWIKPLGGDAPYSYIWVSLTDPLLAGSGFIRDPGDSSLVTSLPNGMYHILVEDKNGCRAEITSVLNDNPFIFDIVTHQDATCNGAENGLIHLLISGATPDASGNYTITTKPGFIINTNDISIGALDPGDYCITVEDEVSQCDTIYCFTIGSTTTITATVAVTAPACAGALNGMVSIGGLTNGMAGPNYSYAIYRNGNLITTAPNIGGVFGYGPLGPGDYMTIVTDGPCISDSIPFTIPDSPPIIATLAGTTLDNCLPSGSGDAWFTITGGTGPYILETSMGFQDGDTIFNLNSGNYILTVTDDNQCTTTVAFHIARFDDNEEADVSFVLDGTPCEQGTFITVLYQGGPIPAGVGVVWSTGEVNDTILIENPDTLSVDVILGNPIFCILDDTVIIDCQKQLQLDITVIQPLCNSAADGGPYTGTVIVDTLNATAPVNWIWSFGETTQSPTYAGLDPGKYYVTVTDALDSTAVDSFEIIAPPAVDISFQSADSVSCPSACDGSVHVVSQGGDPAMDYFVYWTNATPQADTGFNITANDLCAGFTSFSVSQDGVCFYTDSLEILAPEPVKLDLAGAFDATCYGYADGQLAVIASGGTPGYDYSWAGGPASPVNSGLVAGEYFITVTDSKGCVQNDSFSVDQPDTLIADIDLTGTIDLSCGGNNDGTVTVAVTGGNSGIYTFDWNPDVSSIGQAFNLAAGNYLITVTDEKGCTDTTSYMLTSPPPIIVDWPVIIPPDCYGDETMIDIENVTGGSGNYSYNLNGGELFEIGEPVLIPSGIYIINVFDDRGCVTDTTYIVTEPNPILVSIGPDDPVINLGDSLFISGHVDQSDNPIAMMMWTAEVPVSCPTCDGTWVFNEAPVVYTWTVTDDHGCQGSASITVSVDYDRDVFFPNVFSPNRDGRNDDYKIYTGPGVEMINFFHIYDRWGNLVHSVNNLSPDPDGVGNWDGSYKGTGLSPGVYAYVAEIRFIDNNTTLLYRGGITLIK